MLNVICRELMLYLLRHLFHKYGKIITIYQQQKNEFYTNELCFTIQYILIDIWRFVKLNGLTIMQ